MPMLQPGLPFTVLVFIGVIGTLVFVHEFGHYYVARLCGVRADTFSIGFGREIVGWTDTRGTRWKLGWLPLGGYVKFAGDANETSQPDAGIERTPLAERQGLFHFAPLWQKAAITAAGPLTNFALAILIFAGFFMTYGMTTTPPVVGQVEPRSAAAAAGIVRGDRIVAIDGIAVADFETFRSHMAINAGEPVALQIERGGVAQNLSVRPQVLFEVDRFGNRSQRGVLGVRSGEPKYVRVGLLEAVPEAVGHTAFMIKATVKGIWQIIVGLRSVKDLGGPIKMAQLSGQQASLGLPELVQFMAFVSINLGFINLLPIPMLDGGHLFLYALQAVRRRPLGERVQQWAFMSGFAALVSLMVFLTFNDLGSIGVWQHLSGLLG